MTRKGFLAEIAKDEPEEQIAVAAALRGDLKPLARLLRPFNLPEFGVSNEINPTIARPSPETWNLIAQFLAGERNPRTGRMKGKPGRPKMSVEERRKQNRAHAAADEFPVICFILRRFYPQQTRKDISARAEDIAKARANIATSIKNLRNRSGKTRHRV